MKLVLAVVVLAFCTVAFADEECTILQRFKLKHQWREAFGSGHARMVFGLKFWNSLFHDHPEARPLFSRVHGDNTYSPQFEAHIQRVLGGLDMCISLLDDPATLAKHLEHLKGQHAERGIKAEHFEAFIEEMLWVVPDYMSHFMDYSAWNSCLHMIANGIKS